MSTAVRWYLIGGTTAVVVYAVLPDSVGRGLLYLAIGLSGVTAMGVGIRRHRPTPRMPWILLALGAGAWVLGDAAWTVIVLRGVDPFPSGADVLYLLGYPLLAAGLYRLSRARNPGGDRAAVLDALVAGIAMLLVMWVAFIHPTWTASEGTVLARVVGVAYPVGDVILLVQLLYLGGIGAGRSISLRLIGGALAVTLVADVLFQAAPYFPALTDAATVLDRGWVLAYLLLGAAVLDPSMVHITQPAPAGRLERVGIGKQVFVALAIVPVPLVVLVEGLMGVKPHLVEAALAALVVTVLFHLRMVRMAKQMGEQAERLAHLAEMDVLTGLPNRRRFSGVVDASLAVVRAEPSEASVPVLLVVLDRFTEVNDTLGHRVGDELLCAAAERMVERLGGLGHVGRLGGDSFGVELMKDPSDDAVLDLARVLREHLGEPYELSDVTVSVDALVGIAIGPADGTSAADLLQRADVALSVARERSDGVARYSGRMTSGGALGPHLMGELQGALDSGQVVVHYQPQVDLLTGRVTGVEALVRWQHPEHGLLPPVAFIPAAERSGLIRPLTTFVLDSALGQVAEWRVSGRDLRVAVNLSVRNLLDRGFVDDVCRMLARHHVTEESLDLEITESMAMVDPARSIEVLGSLDALGVVLSVDDYGTGYSSLAYLQRLPVQRLKIDRSFVSGLLDDDASNVIVRSTIDLARNLGMSVVAECVEDDATLLALRDMRCDAAQGFGIGRPVPADEVLDLVARIEARLPLVLGAAVATQAGPVL